MPLTVGEVKDFCRTMLGFPSVAVELEENHYGLAFNKVLRVLCYNKPKIKRVPFAVAAGQQHYTITGYGYDVIDVEIPPYEYQLGQEMDVFNPRMLTHPMNIGDYELSLMYGEMTKQVLSSEFESTFDVDTGNLMISPIPSRSYNAVAVCIDEKTGDDIHSPWLKQWCLDYSLALCKQMLGEIRRKIAEIAGTEVTHTLDGTELMQEGIEKENQLLEEMKERSGDFVGPMVAITGK